jgi:osmotically-inducible protein OsmY
MRTAFTACAVAMLSLAACASAPSTHYRTAGFADSRNNSMPARAQRGYEEQRDDALAERDELITSTIRAQFARDPHVDAGDIDVDTYRGTVALSGYVDDRDEIHRAVKIALATPGVRTVRNDMRVSRP